MSSVASSIARGSTLERVADYLELTKPKIAVLELLTVAAACWVASWGQASLATVLHAMLGTLLVAASASALNQWLEQGSDLKMERTRQRPLPAGRLGNRSVLLFATVTLLLGEGHLGYIFGWMTASWAAATWVIYVWIYTPLKTRTSLNTAVGAVAGALPICIGGAAVGGTMTSLAFFRIAAFFAVLFLWQFPHFMAIAWICRAEYRVAGMRMMTVTDPSGRSAGLQSVSAALALLPASLALILYAPWGWGVTTYIVVAIVLGLIQLAIAVWFLRKPNERSARWLLRISLIYLPALLLCLLVAPLG